MSYKVTEAFIERSRSKHGARTVGLIIAEIAYHDATGWIRIEPSKAKRPRVAPEDDQDNIVFRTKLSAKQVRRCVDRLQDLDELEVVRAWDGRIRYFVYRLIVEPFRYREVDYSRGGLSVLEAPFWTPEELLLPATDRRRDGHEFSRHQAAKIGLTSAQNVPSSAVSAEAPRGDIGPPDEGANVPPPSFSTGPVTVTEEANASSVPADAGEREDRRNEIALALSAALGVRVAGMTRQERSGWETAIAELNLAGATSDDVVRRCAAYRRRWPDMALTPFALVRHWSTLADDAHVEAGRSPKDDVAANWAENVSPQLDREEAHYLLDNMSGVTDAVRARLHARIDELQDTKERRAA